jgi:coproporphyrinogen III oxidase
MISVKEITDWFRSLQDEICSGLERLDGTGKFEEDLWERPGGGGGRSRIIRNGSLIEKGGVNFSTVHGLLPEKIARALNVQESEFYATGVSIVLHPVSPMVPIIHMNTRFIGIDRSDGWFGGGIDLTPHYINEDDVSFFHGALEKVCVHFHPSYYPEFRQWADEYFYIPHRKETRGAGGIFFDRLGSSAEFSMSDRFEFVKAVGKTFVPVYSRIAEKNRKLPYGDREKQWQLIRRGRYAEFNLVYDKGTKFGLDTDGRTESVLMSLPPLASWLYDFVPEPGSEEERTLIFLRR